MQFLAYASNIEGNIIHQKLRNGCVAKKLIGRTFSVKFRVFRRESLPNHSVYWAQIFRDNWNCYALSIFSVFILFASSDSDKHNIFGGLKKVKPRFPYHCRWKVKCSSFTLNQRALWANSWINWRFCVNLFKK